MEGRLNHPLMDLLSASNGPGEAKRCLSKALAIHNLRAHTISDSWFLKETTLLTESIRIASVIGSNFTLETNDKKWQYFLVGHEGSILIEDESNQSILSANKVLFLPKTPWKITAEEGVSFTAIGFLDLQLLTTARLIASNGWRPPVGRESPLGSQFKLPIPGDRICLELIKAAVSIIVAMVKLGHSGETFPFSMELEKELYKVIALMAYKSLRDGEIADLAEEEDHVEIDLERILDFINLNLHQPLSISLLQEQSTYSRRSLHYAFKKKLGCTPSEWIRRKRMALALEKLETSNPSKTTVQAIASSCGYKSLNRFYIDFRRAYGCKPYDVLRQRQST